MDSKQEKTDKRLLRTEKALKEALVSLCESNEISDITVSQIVSEAGYSRNAFYSHFESKEHFIMYIIEQEAEAFLAAQRWDTSLAKDPKRMEEARVAAELNMFSHVYANRTLYKLLVTDKLMSFGSDYMAEVIAAKTRANPSYIDEFTSEGAWVEPDWELINYALIMQHFAMIKYWAKTDFKYSPNYMAAQKANIRHKLVRKKKRPAGDE